MKFEAEIIKEIVDSRGHTKTSIHYQSECVDEWVKEVEGAYPKLCDYQPEWLNYSNENKVGIFPYTSLTDVTNATLDNVVPYAYKRAILKGQTLVNQSTTSELTFENAWQGKIIEGNALQSGKKYFVSFDLESDNSELTIQARNGYSFVHHIVKGFTKGKNVLSFILEQDANGLRFQVGSDFNVKISNIIILEYQDGMENRDIPYFTGMQSVKMPALTTSNEDGTKTNILTVNEEVTLRSNGDICDELNLLTRELTQRIGESNSENFTKCSYSSTLFNGYYAAVIDLNNKASSSVIMANLVPSQQGFTDGLDCGIYNNPGNVVVFKKGATLEEIKNLVSNLIIQYQLAEKSVKTVDLSVVDQDGKTLEQIKPIEGTMHLNTSGETIKPLFSGEIPVEAITQNLASFIRG
nr:MAG TPA: hypothetical protein [Caudoviricetes sp.]